MSDTEEHHFEVTVRMWSDGSDIEMTLVKQEVRAWSLNEALQVAAAVPLRHWFPDEEEDDDIGADSNDGEADTLQP